MKTQLLNELTHLFILEIEVKNRIKKTSKPYDLSIYYNLIEGIRGDIYKAFIEIDSKELNRLTKNN